MDLIHRASLDPSVVVPVVLVVLVDFVRVVLDQFDFVLVVQADLVDFAVAENSCMLPDLKRSIFGTLPVPCNRRGLPVAASADHLDLQRPGQLKFISLLSLLILILSGLSRINRFCPVDFRLTINIIRAGAWSKLLLLIASIIRSKSVNYIISKIFYSIKYSLTLLTLILSRLSLINSIFNLILSLLSGLSRLTLLILLLIITTLRRRICGTNRLSI